jgi:serine protease inhibitor
MQEPSGLGIDGGNSGTLRRRIWNLKPHHSSTWTVTAMALALLLTATPDPAGANDGHVATAGEDDPRLTPVPDVDGLGLRIYAQLRQTGDTNLLISPLSTATVLAMVFTGARGETARRMADGLHFPADPAVTNQAFSRLLAASAAPEEDRGATLAMANSLWYQQGLGVREDYRRTIQSAYKGLVDGRDFRGEPEGTRSAINAWVTQETRGKIPELLSPGTVSPQTRLILANAVYFSSPWQDRFPVEKTRMMPFHVPAGEPVDVPMMHQAGLYRYTVTRGAEVLELPYKGRRFTFLILLPKLPGGLADLERSVTADGLTPWLSRLPKTPSFLDVFLPRFELNVRVRLDEALRSLGLGSLFDGDPDLSGIAPNAPPISGVLTQVRLRVDERGAEAAAANATVTERSLPPEFKANRPFLFLIRDGESQLTLFLGRLSDPR